MEVAGDMILYIENLKGATKNPQKEMNSEKLQNTKLIHRSLLYFYTRTTNYQKEIKWIIPVTIASKRIKYLGINLIKETK